MNRIVEKYPGELIVLAFLAMGIAFVLAVVVVEAMGGLAGVGYTGLIDGADFQAGAFPPR